MISRIAGLLLLLLAVANVAVAQTTISNLPAANALNGSENIPADQSGKTVRITPSQLQTYVLNGQQITIGSQSAGFGGSVYTGAWSTYLPTISCGSGSVGAYSRQNGNYQQFGKTIFLNIDVKAAAGTCSGAQTISLPSVTTVSSINQMVAGVDFTSGVAITCTISGAVSSCTAVTASGGNTTPGDNFVYNGVLQTQ